jgi:hypothetical protein
MLIWNPYSVGGDIHQAHQQAAGPDNAPFSPGGQASVLAVQAGDGNKVQMHPPIGRGLARSRTPDWLPLVPEV